MGRKLVGLGTVLVGAVGAAAALRPRRRSRSESSRPTRGGSYERLAPPEARRPPSQRGATEANEPRAAERAGADDRGRTAESPAQIPAKGWRDVLVRVKRELADDRVSFLAAGVAFYAFLAIFPALAALVSLYGLIAEPADVQRQLGAMSGALPAEARGILDTQLRSLVTGSTGALGLGFAVSILLALWSANKGTTGLVSALNVVYDEQETRGFVRKNAATLGLTAGGVVLILFAIGAVVALPALLGAIGLSRVGELVLRWARWPLLAILMMFALSAVYALGPSRQRPRWRWVSWGAAAATVLWLLGSAAFSLYVSKFGNFGKTYGSLAAVVILLLWLNLSAYVVLLGGELNAELERQTTRDSTTGTPKPLGRRGAFSADTVAESP